MSKNVKTDEIPNRNLEREQEIIRSADQMAIDTIKEFYPKIRANATDFELYMTHKDIVHEGGKELFDFFLQEVVKGRKLNTELADEIAQFRAVIISKAIEQHFGKLPKCYKQTTFIAFCEKAVDDSIAYHSQVYEYWVKVRDSIVDDI